MPPPTGKTTIIGLLALLSVLPILNAADDETTTAGAFAFTYFYAASEDAGVHLAVSLDGVHWETVNNDEPVLRRPSGKVVRDPSVTRTPDGDLALVWTTSWGDPGDQLSAGFARTKDFIDWYDIREIPLMRNTPGSVNVWAPELFFDPASKRWLIYWASSVEGRFPQTAPLGSRRANNRVYRATSADLASLDSEQLLYDEGFITNDSYIFTTSGDPRGAYCMIVKKILQPGKGANLYLAFAESAAGPYRLTGDPISGNYAFCEGPSVIRIGEYYYCYFDLSREHRIGCVRSKVLNASPWEDMTGRLTFSPAAKHGSIVRISHELFERLRNLDPR